MYICIHINTYNIDDAVFLVQVWLPKKWVWVAAKERQPEKVEQVEVFEFDERPNLHENWEILREDERFEKK